MSYMPSTAYVAEQLFKVGADTNWEDISQEEKDSHMVLARTAISAIVSWQARAKGNGLQRYSFEQYRKAPDDQNTWAIYDRNRSGEPIGTVHDPLLAQQIIDDLNKRDVKKDMRQTLNELAEK